MQVTGQGRVEGHSVDFALDGNEAGGIKDDREILCRVRVAAQKKAHFHLGWRIANANPKQKSVQLGFRQRKRANEVLRVLRGDDEEGVRQRQRLAVQRDLPLAHGLQQRRLGSGAGAVDLVGQQDVGKDGTLSKDEFGSTLVVNRNPKDIAGKEVAGELNPPQLTANGAGEGASQGGFPNARDIVDEQMASGEKRDESQFDGFTFSFKRRLDGLSKSLKQGKLFGEHCSRCGHGIRACEGVGERGTARSANCKNKGRLPEVYARKCCRR
jgi:hypothetical protein